MPENIVTFDSLEQQHDVFLQHDQLSRESNRCDVTCFIVWENI